MDAVQGGLGALVERAQRMTSEIEAAEEVPRVQLSLELLARASQKMLLEVPQARAREEAEAQGKYLLSGAGVNAEDVTSAIQGLDVAAAYEPVVPMSDVDVNGHIRYTHEQEIVGVISNVQKRTQRDLSESFERQAQRSWKRQRARIIEEMGVVDVPDHHRGAPVADSASLALAAPSTKTSHPLSPVLVHDAAQDASRGLRTASEHVSQPASTGALVEAGPASAFAPLSTSFKGNSGTAARVDAYLEAATWLNDARGETKDQLSPVSQVAQHFGDGIRALQTAAPENAQVAEAWALVGFLCGEQVYADTQSGAVEQPQANAYRASREAADPELDAHLAKRARAYLEDHFVKHMNKILANSDQKLGGVPSVVQRIRAYVALRYSGAQIVPNLERVDGSYPWAVIYLLLRSGHAQEAYSVAKELDALSAHPDRYFGTALLRWLDNGHNLPQALRDALVLEYSQQAYDANAAWDPFKLALYRLIARIDVHRKQIPHVTLTTEDYVWFQLSLISEPGHGSSASKSENSLRKFAAFITDHGPSHFDAQGTRPLAYFRVLLLVGEIERAVAYLANQSLFYADAVNISLVFSYYGLIRVAPVSKDLALLDDAHPARLHIDRLFVQYSRQFLVRSPPNATAAALYLIQLSLNADAPTGSQQIETCESHLRDIILDPHNDVSALLGDVKLSGVKTPGLLDKSISLLGQNADLASSTIASAAARSQTDRNAPHAILLYALVSDSRNIARTIITELGNRLTAPSPDEAFHTKLPEFKTAFWNESVAVAASTNILSTAQVLLQSSSTLLARIAPADRSTLETLIKLSQAKLAFDNQSYDTSIALFTDAKILPASGDIVSTMRLSNELPSFDDAIVSHLDVLILTYMRAIAFAYSATRALPHRSLTRCEELKAMARGLMLFAGMLRYRLSNDTYQSLTQLDVQLS